MFRCSPSPSGVRVLCTQVPSPRAGTGFPGARLGLGTVGGWLSGLALPLPHKGMVLTGGSLLSSTQMWAGGVCGVQRAGCCPYCAQAQYGLLCHLRVPANCVPTYRCSPCGSSTTVAPVLPSPSPLPCAGAEGVQSILGSAGRFWGKTKALPPRCILGIPAPVCAPLLSAVREGARAAPVGSWCTSSCIKNGLGQRRANHPSLPRSSKALAPRAASSWRRAGEAFELIGSSLPPART